MYWNLDNFNGVHEQGGKRSCFVHSTTWALLINILHQVVENPNRIFKEFRPRFIYVRMRTIAKDETGAYKPVQQTGRIRKALRVGKKSKNQVYL